VKKKAKRKLVDADDDTAARTPTASRNAVGREGVEDAPGGTAQSVEVVLQEFSAGGTHAPLTARPPRSRCDRPGQLSVADPDTGLANRLLLLGRLEQALARRRRHGGEVVVCRIDLDNLGEITADLGDATGNTVLCEVARRLTSVLRAEDTVGRVGASELVVVLAVTGGHAVGPLVRRLQHILDGPVMVGAKDIRLHASLGVAVTQGSESAEDMLARPDRSARVTGR
jgi:diguanylate cyclase (GGDEF)-like protein